MQVSENPTKTGLNSNNWKDRGRSGFRCSLIRDPAPFLRDSFPGLFPQKAAYRTRLCFHSTDTPPTDHRPPLSLGEPTAPIGVLREAGFPLGSSQSHPNHKKPRVLFINGKGQHGRWEDRCPPPRRTAVTQQRSPGGGVRPCESRKTLEVRDEHVRHLITVMWVMGPVREPSLSLRGPGHCGPT